jgi:rRNA maturation endonuclease Nob1
MFFAAAVLVTLVILGFTLFIRSKDLPEPTPVSPYHHLEVRKASIYENLRDLQFEYRVGKLSDEDYQRTKLDLQAGLAVVLAEIDKLKQMEGAPAAGGKSKGVAKKSDTKPDSAKVCPHCSAKFEKPLKFCGECGKPMVAEAG